MRGMKRHKVAKMATNNQKYQIFPKWLKKILFKIAKKQPKWQNKTREMRVIRTDERNEEALRPAQHRQGRVSGPF